MKIFSDMNLWETCTPHIRCRHSCVRQRPLPLMCPRATAANAAYIEHRQIYCVQDEKYSRQDDCDCAVYALGSYFRFFFLLFSVQQNKSIREFVKFTKLCRVVFVFIFFVISVSRRCVSHRVCLNCWTNRMHKRANFVWFSYRRSSRALIFRISWNRVLCTSYSERLFFCTHTRAQRERHGHTDTYTWSLARTHKNSTRINFQQRIKTKE